MDIFHKVFLVARDGLDLDYALSREQPPKILDLGTGTGIWSIHVAECVSYLGFFFFTVVLRHETDSEKGVLRCRSHGC